MFFLWSGVTETSHIIVWLRSIIICNDFNILNKHYQLFSFSSLQLYVTNPWLLVCLDASTAISAAQTTQVRVLGAVCCGSGCPTAFNLGQCDTNHDSPDLSWPGTGPKLNAKGAGKAIGERGKSHLASKDCILLQSFSWKDTIWLPIRDLTSQTPMPSKQQFALWNQPASLSYFEQSGSSSKEQSIIFSVSWAH